MYIVAPDNTASSYFLGIRYLQPSRPLTNGYLPAVEVISTGPPKGSR